MPAISDLSGAPRADTTFAGLRSWGRRIRTISNEQRSCSELTGLRAGTEHCYRDSWRPWASLRVLPRRVFCSGGAEVVRRMALHKTSEDLMTKPKSRPAAATRSAARKPAKAAPRKRPTRVSSKPATRPDTKRARIIAMLRAPAGATIAAIMKATDWQQHSVRGFMASIVRKKLGLDLVSEQTDKGRVYRIRDGKASSADASLVKRAA